LILLAAPAVLAAQQRPEAPPAGALSGVVADGASGAPIAGAIVTLASDPAQDLPDARQITDEKGRFAFVHLPADATYTVEVSRYGYLPGGVGRERSPADPLRPLRLPRSGWLGDVHVPLWKPGAIGGTVRDESGEPVVGVLVRALIRLRLGGRDLLAAGRMTMTDDRGEYRLANLHAGRYVIQVPSVQSSIPASTPFSARGPDPEAAIDVDDTSRLVIGPYPLPPPPLDGRPRSYPMAFHPADTAVGRAATIDLEFGDERTGVDVTLTPVPAFRVSGIVDGPPDALTYLTVRLLPAGLESLGQGAEAATALVDAQGRFSFLNVPAGAYTIDAPLRMSELSTSDFRVGFPVPPGRYGWSRQSETVDGIAGLRFISTDFRGGSSGKIADYSGRASVVVDADTDDVVVRLRANAAMRGRVVTETLKGVPPPQNFMVRLDPASADAALDMPTGRVLQDADAPGAFAVSGLRPGRYWLRVRGSANWVVKSIAWKGRDYTHEPFDATAGEDFDDVVVTVTDAGAELTGSVRGSDAQLLERAMVVVFPTAAGEWRDSGFLPDRMRSAAVTGDGTYRFAALPAGDYLVVAIDRSQAATWRDPEVLADLQRSAARVTLRWGATLSQDVQAVAIRRGGE
jgi:hypothetical protein